MGLKKHDKCQKLLQKCQKNDFNNVKQLLKLFDKLQFSTEINRKNLEIILTHEIVWRPGLRLVLLLYNNNNKTSIKVKILVRVRLGLVYFKLTLIITLTLTVILTII